jgi:hypothetical protein
MPTSISMRTPASLNTTRQQLDELDTLLKRMLALPVNQLDVKDEAEAEAAEDAAEEPPPAPITQPTAAEPIAAPIAAPMSYMVVETASPRPLPPASGFEPRPSLLKPTPPENVAKAMEPAATVAPAPSESPAAESEAWVPLRSTWQPSAQTWQPLADSWRQANGAAPAPAVVPAPIPNPPSDSAQPTPVLIEIEAAAAQATPSSEIQIPSSEPQNAEPKTQNSVVGKSEPPLSLTAEDAPSEPSSLLLPLLWFNQGFDSCVAPLGTAGRWLCGPNGRQMLGIAGLACLAAAVVVAISTGMAWTW